MTSSSHSDENRIKTGASFLAKGGTLTSEPCTKCNGVQVRLGDKTICINCGNEIKEAVRGGGGGGRLGLEREQEKPSTPRISQALTSTASMIEEKIARLTSDIRIEDDLSLQRQKVELLEKYLGILEKTKNLIQ